jgi:hypothetical protein
VLYKVNSNLGLEEAESAGLVKSGNKRSKKNVVGSCEEGMPVLVRLILPKKII